MRVTITMEPSGLNQVTLAAIETATGKQAAAPRTVFKSDLLRARVDFAEELFERPEMVSVTSSKIPAWAKVR